MSILTEAQHNDILNWLKEQDVYPLFLRLAGSHVWGLETSTSDIDVRGVYTDNATRLLKLYPDEKGKGYNDTIEEVNFNGQHIDIQLYEVEKYMGMLRSGNGNAVMFTLQPEPPLYDRYHQNFPELAEKFLTKKLHDYFKGYATSQRKRSAQNRGGKALIYTYREIFEGIHVMREGVPLFKFDQLKQWMSDNLSVSYPLLDWALVNRTTPVTDDQMVEFDRDWVQLCTLLDEATADSKLPDEYNGYEECNNMLLEERYLICIG